MHRLGTALLAIAIALALLGCGDDDAAPAPPPDGPMTFKVMTQNLFLGGQLELALAPGVDLPEAVEQIWASVQATDFGERAKVIAAVIDAEEPDLIGLQEATLWRTQAPGDGLLFPNATTVAEDFVVTLMNELATRGLSYQVAATVVNADLELPGASGTDYRLTDRDVILAKTSLPVFSTASGTFPFLAIVEAPPPNGGAPIQASIPRGWVSAEFRAGGKTVRLVNTHLEAFSAEVAAIQAVDLVDVAAPARQPTIVLGDVNLPPGSAGYANLVTGTGLSDAWSALHGADPGLTCCWSRDLTSGAYTNRIDDVFTSAGVRATSARKVNETERTPGGLAPSDHAGVVVELTAE